MKPCFRLRALLKRKKMSPIMPTTTKAPPTPIPAAAPALSFLLPSDEVLPAAVAVSADEVAPAADVPAVGMTSVKVGAAVPPERTCISGHDIGMKYNCHTRQRR